MQEYFDRPTKRSMNKAVKKCGSLVLLMRVILPVIMMCILMSYAHPVWVGEIEISLSAVSFFLAGVHLIAAWKGLWKVESKGLLYELSACFLATESVLFLYFMQDNMLCALMLAVIFGMGLVWLFIAGRRQLMDNMNKGCILQRLMNDMKIYRKENMRCNLFSVALRRYMVIASAMLMLMPAMVVVFDWSTNERGQIGKENGVLSKNLDNLLLENIDALQLLQEERWYLLTEQEQVDVLQMIADIETQHMGIEAVSVVNCCLDDRVIGSYSYDGRQAKIDIKKHEGYAPVEYVNTILHECRHAYQYDCILSLDWTDSQVQNGIYFSQARTWRYEHENYISMSMDKEGYFNQAIEKDARLYAEEGVLAYQRYIYLDHYLGDE